MEKNIWSKVFKLNIVVLTTVIAMMLLSAPLAGAKRAVTQANTDGIDEIVVVGTDGYVYAYNKDGDQVFKSPEGGWELVTTADMNGDGDAEIIAVGGNTIKVYDPQVVGTVYSFEATYSGSGSFTTVRTGDLIQNNGTLEIALLRSVSGKGRVVAYAPPDTTPKEDVEFLTDWRDMAIGDFDADGDDDYALTYWNGSLNLLELRKGHDPSTKLQDSDGASFLSNSEWVDIEPGNLLTNDNGRMEWVASEKGTGIFAQKWDTSKKKPRNIWSTGTSFDFLATADFRNDGDDQVAMLRNVTSGTSLQFVRDGDTKFKPWSSVSGLGTGWLNLAAGNLDDETTYKEAVIIKNNLIRVFLKPQAGSYGDSTYLDCNTAGNCFEAFNLASNLNGALAVGDLGVTFDTVVPYQISTTNIVQTVAQSQTVPTTTFYIYGETTQNQPISWRAMILPGWDALFLREMLKQDPNLSLSITPSRIQYNSTQGTGELPTVDWITLNAFTGTTPSTITTVFSDTYPGSPLFNTGAYKASILILRQDNQEDVQWIDVTVLVGGTKIYLPLIMK